MARDASRVELLARRVGWLDRNRRKLAIAISALLTPPMLIRVVDVLGDDWPGVHAFLIGVVLCVATWAIAETMLAWLAAFWDTEYAQLQRDHQVPPARLRRHRRRWFRRS